MLRIDRQPARLGKSVREVVRKVQLASPSHEFVLDWPADDPDGARGSEAHLPGDPEPDDQRGQVLAGRRAHHGIGAYASGASWSSRSPTRGLEYPRGRSIESSTASIASRARCRAASAAPASGWQFARALSKRTEAASGPRALVRRKGSTFCFTLPLLVETLDVSSVPATPSRSKGAHDHQEANRPRRR